MTGEEIKRLRLAIGVTQTVFAQYLGVLESTVSRWERNLHPPSTYAPKRLLRLAKEAFAADPERLRKYFERRDFTYPP